MNAIHCPTQCRCAAALAGAWRQRARIVAPGQRIEATCRRGAPAFDV